MPRSKSNEKMVITSFHIPPDELELIDEFVKWGFYPSRSEFIRYALAKFLSDLHSDSHNDGTALPTPSVIPYICSGIPQRNLVVRRLRRVIRKLNELEGGIEELHRIAIYEEDRHHATKQKRLLILRIERLKAMVDDLVQTIMKENSENYDTKERRKGEKKPIEVVHGNGN